MKKKTKKYLIEKKMNLKMVNYYNEFIGKENLDYKLKNIGSGIYALELENYYYVVAKDDLEKDFKVVGIFNLRGEPLVLQDKLTDKIEIVDNKKVAVYKKQSYGYDKLNYEISSLGIALKSVLPLRENFERYQEANYLNRPLLNNLGIYYLNNYEKGNQADIYFVYNKETKQKLFTCHKIDFNYSEYNNVAKDKYILITKRIEGLGKQANLKFFIDEYGNLVSDIYDEELGLYFKKTSIEELSSLLEKISKVVTKLLRDEAIATQSKNMQIIRVRKRVSEMTLK